MPWASGPNCGRLTRRKTRLTRRHNRLTRRHSHMSLSCRQLPDSYFKLAKIFGGQKFEKFWGIWVWWVWWDYLRFPFIYTPHCPGYPRLILRGALKYLYFHPQSPLQGEGEAKSIVTKYFSFLCHHKCQDLNTKGSLKERVSESFFHPRSPGWHQVS